MTKQTHGPAERVQSLIDITESLGKIMIQENALLANQRADEMEPLQKEKIRLAAAYTQSIRDIAEDRALAASADLTLLSELREITKTFEEHAANQCELLNGAQ